MSTYTKQNFSNGTVLTAQMLNHIENGIYDISVNLENNTNSGSSNNTNSSETNTFKGKVISVLGDSISACGGYIPVEDGWNLKHDQQYASTFVNKMWWKIVIDKLGAKLGICDAWDGTQVRNTSDVDSGKIGPNTYIGSSTRLINLGSNGTPDIILVFAGTNDTRSATTTSIGKFNFETEYEPMTEDDIFNNKTSNVLVEAYTALIRKIQYLYPYAKVVCLGPMYGKPFALSANMRSIASAAIKDVCDYFGCLYIDPIKCGLNINNTWRGNTTYFKDGIHPNETGMKLIGDYVYKQIKNTFEFKDDSENIVYKVTNSLINAKTSYPQIVGVSKNSKYTATLSGIDDYSKISVYMGGNNVTSTALTGDTILIPSVIGDIIIVENN